MVGAVGWFFGGNFGAELKLLLVAGKLWNPSLRNPKSEAEGPFAVACWLLDFGSQKNIIFVCGFQNPKAKKAKKKKAQQKGPEYVRVQGDMLVGSWVHMISLFRNSSSIHFEMSKKNKTKNACVLLRLLYTHKIFQWKNRIVIWAM